MELVGKGGYRCVPVRSVEKKQPLAKTTLGKNTSRNLELAGGFKHFFNFIPGEMESNLTCAYFSDGWVKNHQQPF